MGNRDAFPVIVPKVWGKEIWLVNEPEYCCKMLEINKGACSSLHYHPIKRETFLVAVGKIRLEHGESILTLKAGPRAVTIPPGEIHRFKGVKASVILEISTHHDDQDVVRLVD